MAKLWLKRIVKRYGDVTAVDGVSLDVAHGEVVSLLGPSGCGKTTTLHMLAGFLRPDEGAILIDDKVVHTLPPEKRNTGMVFQNYALFPHMTVAGNIAFGLEMRSTSRSDIAARTAKVLDLVRLKGFEDRYPKQLSGGQQQRVALARALVVEPSLLLLDEPLSNLDATLREEMRFEIREIQRRVGITTIFVTHDQTEAMAISDRLAVMNKGRIAQIGAPVDVYRAPIDKFVASFIGQASLIPGEVIATGPSSIIVRAADGTLLTVPPSEQGFGEDSKVNVVVRPEDLGVSPRPVDGKNSLSATIASATYLGSSTRLVALVGNVTIATSTNRPPPELVVGAKTYLVWDPAHCALVPGDNTVSQPPV
jgi:putative spermidine/putrescine transport system ATP-binding protein